jgi:acyl-[acyl-carrier-protein] desaturase
VETLPDVPVKPEPPEILDAVYRLFREMFDLAERRRRWSIADDVPWGECNRSLNPAIADVVESACTVELYLPDYLSKLLVQVRGNRARAWWLANWGYEESKHSMVLEDWLLRSGQRSDEQIADVHREVFSHEWNPPYDNARAMLAYTVFQELATRTIYLRLADAVRRDGGCPALEKALSLVAVDEAAHADFFRRLTEVYLQYDREGTLEQMRLVVNTFRMPAYHMFTDSRERRVRVEDLNLFNEQIFIEQIFEPAIARMGVTRGDLRRKKRREVSTPAR